MNADLRTTRVAERRVSRRLACSGLGKSTIGQTFGRSFHLRQVSLYGPMTSAGDERVP